MKFIFPKDIEKIFVALDNQARLVGGCVRDMLLDITPKDFDIATPITPTEVTKKLENIDVKVIATGIKHGTVTAVINGNNYEITTLRKDISCNGRHAEIEYTGDWEIDAKRRDLTINAMSVDIDGNKYDYCDGEKDLLNSHIKFIGDPIARCDEDYLRILRFFRFYACFGKSFDQASIDACAAGAKNLEFISGERVNTEMSKLIMAKSPVEALSLMRDSGVITYLLPGYMEFGTLDCLLKKFGNDFCNISRLAAILSGLWLEKEDVIKIANRWRMSNKERDMLIKLIVVNLDLPPAAPRDIQQKIIYELGNSIFEIMVKIRCAQEIADGASKEVEELYNNMLDFSKEWPQAVFEIKGRDLEELGIKPGQKMGEILDQAEKWWIESSFKSSKEQIMNYIKENFS